MENRKFGALSSSVDGAKLAKTVEGALKLVGGVIAYFGYSAFTGDVNSVADQVGTAITLGVSFFGAVEVLWGSLRKVLVKLTAKPQ